LTGQDLRGLPLGDRKKRLARLLGGRRLGIVLSDHTAEDGATILRQACMMGLEGRDWIKVKNPDSPAMVGHREDPL
jgi:bifunctional non-homologous end joining protein LigD